MPITVTCPKCRKRMVAKDEAAGRMVKCSGCRTLIRAGDTPDAGLTNLALQPVAEFTSQDQAIDHLRAIRLYVGWLLILTSVPAVLSVAVASAWLVAWAVRVTANP